MASLNVRTLLYIAADPPQRALENPPNLFSSEHGRLHTMFEPSLIANSPEHPGTSRQLILRGSEFGVYRRPRRQPDDRLGTKKSVFLTQHVLTRPYGVHEQTPVFSPPAPGSNVLVTVAS